MIKILMVCHGNICRSPMAEFVFRDMAAKKGLDNLFQIASAATSSEELGNPVHHGTRQKLKEHGILTDGKRAMRLKQSDYRDYDYLIGMDKWNIKNMIRILDKDPEAKIHQLLDFTGQPGDIADPWYTGDFECTYRDVHAGCTGLLEYIMDHM